MPNTAPVAKSKTPRPECGDCPALKRPCGCGFLGAGTPCKAKNAKREVGNAS